MRDLLKNLKLDMRVVGLLFVMWGFEIMLEGLLGIFGSTGKPDIYSYRLLTRCIMPLVIGFFLYFKGDDVLMRIKE